MRGVAGTARTVAKVPSVINPIATTADRCLVDIIPPPKADKQTSTVRWVHTRIKLPSRVTQARETEDQTEVGFQAEPITRKVKVFAFVSRTWSWRDMATNREIYLGWIKGVLAIIGAIEFIVLSLLTNDVLSTIRRPGTLLDP